MFFGTAAVGCVGVAIFRDSLILREGRMGWTPIPPEDEQAVPRSNGPSSLSLMAAGDQSGPFGAVVEAGSLEWALFEERSRQSGGKCGGLMLSRKVLWSWGVR